MPVQSKERGLKPTKSVLLLTVPHPGILKWEPCMRGWHWDRLGHFLTTTPLSSSQELSFYWCLWVFSLGLVWFSRKETSISRVVAKGTWELGWGRGLRIDHGSPAEEGWLEIVCTLFEPHLWARLWIVIISVIFAIWYRFPVNAGFVKLIILVLWVIFCSKWTLSNCHH